MSDSKDLDLVLKNLTAEQKTDMLLNGIATALQKTPSEVDDRELFLRYRALEVQTHRAHELNRDKHNLDVQKYQNDEKMRWITMIVCLLAIVSLSGVIGYFALSTSDIVTKGLFITPLCGLMAWVFHTLGKVSKSDEKFDSKPKV